MIVVTWNVLHRIHAVNWEAPALAHWKTEQERIAAIATAVRAWIEGGVDAVCLQEVSGDLLTALRDTNVATVHAFTYDRIPTYWRRSEPATLAAPSEHLVVVARDDVGQVVAGEAFAEDPGKGLLAVALASGTWVVSTHVSYDGRRGPQLARLAAVARDAPEGIVIGGDFNAARERCAEGLGDDLVCALPRQGARVTRPFETPREGAPGHDIDHVFVRGFSVDEVEVIDAAGRSDHNPVYVALSAHAEGSPAKGSSARPTS